MRARRRFTELSRSEHVAVIAIDLSVVFARQGAFDKVALIATEALPILKRLNCLDDKEVRNGLRFVRKAIDKMEVDSKRFEQLQAKLQHILRTHPAIVLDDKTKDTE